MKRRLFLKGAAASSVVVAAAGAGLITPRTVLAAWPAKAFEAKSTSDVLKSLLNGSDTNPGDIAIKAPDIAENGAVVPVTVSTKIDGVESITFLVEKNDQPLAASFNLGATTQPFVASRVKMAKTSNLTAVVKAGGKLYSKSKEVKVTIGGCGG